MAQQKEKGVISGKAYWTHIHKHDDYNNRFQVDIGDLSEESVQLLEKNGVKIKPFVNSKGKEHKSGGDYVVSHTKFVKKGSVSEQFPNGVIGIPIIDSNKNPWDIANTRIGNGSEVKVRVTYNKDHPFVDEWGTSLWLDKVQVTDLVPYDDAGSNFDEDF